MSSPIFLTFLLCGLFLDTNNNGFASWTRRLTQQDQLTDSPSPWPIAATRVVLRLLPTRARSRRPHLPTESCSRSVPEACALARLPTRVVVWYQAGTERLALASAPVLLAHAGIAARVNHLRASNPAGPPIVSCDEEETVQRRRCRSSCCARRTRTCRAFEWHETGPQLSSCVTTAAPTTSAPSLSATATIRGSRGGCEYGRFRPWGPGQGVDGDQRRTCAGSLSRSGTIVPFNDGARSIAPSMRGCCCSCFEPFHGF